MVLLFQHLLDRVRSKNVALQQIKLHFFANMPIMPMPMIKGDGAQFQRQCNADADIKAVKPSSLRLPVRCAPRKSERLSQAHARHRRWLPHKGYPPAIPAPPIGPYKINPRTGRG